MSSKSNQHYERVLLPTSTNGTDSDPFAVPAGAKAGTFFVPALVGTGATLKLQGLKPALQDNETEAWSDLTVFDVSDGSFEALDGLVESTTVVIPTSILGGGVLRFVASEAQTGAADALEVRVLWLM